jgi:copper chaperone
MTTTTFTVSGMTCGHCVAAVSEEIVKIHGVATVDIDLNSGIVTVESAEPIDPDLITEAVDEAGYELAP